MRKLTKLLIPALLIVAIMVSCAVIFASAADEVVYIANESKGTGDGSSPENAMGHGKYTGTVKHTADGVTTPKEFTDAPYAEVVEYIYSLNYGEVTFETNKLHVQNAFFKAFAALKSTGGTIVVTEEIDLDISGAMKNSTATDVILAAYSNNITVTSVYGSNDYRTSGAKLILNHSKWNAGIIEFMGPVTLKDLTIDYKYHTKHTQGSWENGFHLYACGKDFTVDAGVKVNSIKVAENGSTSQGDRYPNIFAGRRYLGSTSNPVITVKSGTWNGVFAAGHGMSSAEHGDLTGNVTVNVSGGNITKIYGAGSNTRKTAELKGNLALNITGGKVSEVLASSCAGVTGDVDITVNKPGFVGTVLYKSENAVAPASVDVKYDKGYIGMINEVEKFTDVQPPFDPNAKRVIYVSADGTGDGLSPETPIGNAEGYVAGQDKSDKLNALYLAANEIKSTGGVIVLVGEVRIAEAASRSAFGSAPSEFSWPSISGDLWITSTYDGVDYAKTNGAKLVIDYSVSTGANLPFTSNTTIENIDILYKYRSDKSNSWGSAFMFGANGKELTIGEGVNVTSYDVTYDCDGEVFPNIVGGHRYSNKSTAPKVTIKSGTWGTVIAGSWGMVSGTPYGKVDADATLIIEGGKIAEVFGTGSTNQPSGTVTGKVTIDVLGGEVDRVTFSNSVVYPGTGSVVTLGKDAVIKFADYAVKDYKGDLADLKTRVTFVNNNSVVLGVEPPKEPFVLYVANIAKGKGDGSSPENAMGHDADYYQVRAQALQIIAANGGTNSGLTGDNKTIVGSVYKKNALYKALAFKGNRMIKQGGIIVVCDILTIDATDAMRKSLADFWSPTTGSETITITSKAPDGKDYRVNNAALILDTSELGLCVEFGSPMVLDHLVIEHRYNSKNGKSIDNGAIIAGRGKGLTIGYDVYMLATDVNPDADARIEMWPSLLGGHRYTDSKADTRVTVGSGNWAAVVGGDWGSTHTGNATISIDGSAKIGTVCGTIKPTASGAKNIFDGSVWIGLWGGEVDNVICVAKPGMKWGDASIGLGGTKVNGTIRATHADYSGEEIQAWVFNYTDAQIDTEKVIGFENPVPATGSYTAYYAVVAVIALAGAALLISKKRRCIED